MESGGREEVTESKLQSEVSAVVMWSAGVGGGWFALFLPSPESTQILEHFVLPSSADELYQEDYRC